MKTSGFTLIELMVVVAIIAILGVVAFTVLNGGVVNRLGSLPVVGEHLRGGGSAPIVDGGGGGVVHDGAANQRNNNNLGNIIVFVIAGIFVLKIVSNVFKIRSSSRRINNS